MSDDYTEREVIYQHSTPRALLLAFECDNYNEHWVPRSVVENADDVEEGSDTAMVKDWWLETNSLSE